MYICKDCFLDEELRSEVISNATCEGVCEVCGKEGKLLDFSEFHNFFDTLLSLFTPESHGNRTIVDILQEDWNFFKDKKVAAILLSDVIKKHTYNYSISTYITYKQEIQNRIAIWERLKKNVKENSRFFTNIDEFNQYNYLTPGKSLHTGQKLYRSRITPVGKKRLKAPIWVAPPEN